MIDYSNILEAQPLRVRVKRRRGRFLLVLVIIACAGLWHLVAGEHQVKRKAPVPAGPTSAQIQTMRANGVLLSQRSLVP
jgi:hypothetical protein